MKMKRIAYLYEIFFVEVITTRTITYEEILIQNSDQYVLVVEHELRHVGHRTLQMLRHASIDDSQQVPIRQYEKDYIVIRVQGQQGEFLETATFLVFAIMESFAIYVYAWQQIAGRVQEDNLISAIASWLGIINIPSRVRFQNEGFILTDFGDSITFIKEGMPCSQELTNDSIQDRIRLLNT
eukprot:TRINITY_DN20634_c1_g1_i1.p3 TRINITY_DN20634_c1_g1~~TRINITY_DN20634_c1_g1_i1.p3  ORF type:complete len:182 (-),score=3.12 TRINITY_DN20634_c1_g1_i1:291-836(-)